MKYFTAFIITFLLSIASVNAQTLLSDGELQSGVITGHDIVEKAKQYIGVPYRSGQSNPKRGFDCSGFTSYVYKSLNIRLTRSSRSQYAEGTKIKHKKDLQKGDLVFFKGSRSASATIGHVGIVTEVGEGGDFKFIHAARKGITIDSSQDPYYKKRYVGASRILEG